MTVTNFIMYHVASITLLPFTIQSIKKFYFRTFPYSDKIKIRFIYFF